MSATWAPAALPGRSGLLHPRAQGAVVPEDRAQRQPDRRLRRRRWPARSRSSRDLHHVPLILAAIAVGAVGGVLGARTRADDPDAAAGGAVQRRRRRRGGPRRARRAARDRRASTPASTPQVHARATAFTILVGSVSFAGSVVTFVKLQELMTTRPVVFPGLPDPLRRCASSPPSCSSVALVVTAGDVGWASCSALLGLLVGVLFVLPVGGADVPIVISLLNAFTGLDRRGQRLRARQHAAARRRHPGRCVRHVPDPADGHGHGPLASPTSCSARSRAARPLGARRGHRDRPVRSAGPRTSRSCSAYADKVVIVPGYGLAVAQAQHTLRELVDLLVARGVEVVYGIHPVAGRMPGHMNVLLAEANVPYEQLIEMDEINPSSSDDRRRARRRRQRRRQPGRPDHARRPDLRHADPQRRRGRGRSSSSSARCARASPASRTSCSSSPKTTLLFGDAKDSLARCRRRQGPLPGCEGALAVLELARSLESMCDAMLNRRPPTISRVGRRTVRGATPRDPGPPETPSRRHVPTSG